MLVLLLRPSNLFGAPPPPERVDLTLLAGATEKGAGTLSIRPCRRSPSFLHEPSIQLEVV
jgi:hypothetical protein